MFTNRLKKQIVIDTRREERDRSSDLRRFEKRKRESKITLADNEQYVIDALYRRKGHIFIQISHRKYCEYFRTLRGASEFLINRRVTDNQAIMSIQLMTLDQIIINVPVSRENCQSHKKVIK